MKSNSTNESNSQNNQESGNQPNHNQCLKMLELVLDGEASEEEQEYFEQHLQNCMPYYEIYNLDKTIRGMIKEKCCKKVPEGLADEIRNKIGDITQ
ncbi:MAG: zf-HC2 domain-containing protein [Bacteroidota bacterium]